MNSIKNALVVFSSLCLFSVANANPKELAEKHFLEISRANVTKLIDNYHPDASLNWVGGPLNGTYKNLQEITAVWGKFTSAQGALEYKVRDLIVSENPLGATVTADVDFIGKQLIKVKYVITYRNDKVIAETWQIVPSRQPLTY